MPRHDDHRRRSGTAHSISPPSQETPAEVALFAADAPPKQPHRSPSTPAPPRSSALNALPLIGAGGAALGSLGARAAREQPTPYLSPSTAPWPSDQPALRPAPPPSPARAARRSSSPRPRWPRYQARRDLCPKRRRPGQLRHDHHTVTLPPGVTTSARRRERGRRDLDLLPRGGPETFTCTTHDRPARVPRSRSKPRYNRRRRLEKKRSRSGLRRRRPARPIIPRR